LVGHPFDTYKVWLQTSGTKLGRCSDLTFSGLFRGVGAPLSTAAIINALVFGSFVGSSRIYDDYFILKERIPKSNSVSGDYYTLQKSFICGSVAGTIQSIVVCPADHIKCRLQIQQGRASLDPLKGSIDAIGTIFKSHGLKGLYRGYTVTAWREIPAYGVYFASYNFVKERIESRKMNTSPWVASILAGSFAGGLSWTIIYPIDVIKTRIQTAPLNSKLEKRKILFVGNWILKKYGWKYLFRGLNVTLLRAIPVNGIIFPIYEFTLRQLTCRGVRVNNGVEIRDSVNIL